MSDGGAAAVPPFFSQTSDGVFAGNPPARGPWSVDHCHAGPVAGLVARAIEQAIGPEKAFMRLTLDLLRPIPMAGIKVVAEVVRDGRTAATAKAHVLDGEGRVCVSATSMHLARAEIGPVPTAPGAAPQRGEARMGGFPMPAGFGGAPCFPNFVEVAYPPGETPEPGPTTLWMRTPPLLAGERPSPMQAICPLADCGNAISRNAEFGGVTFLNSDLTIYMHREPEGGWLGSRAASHWRRTGIGVSEAVIFDQQGPVAAALQTLLLRPPPS